jgi:hypothetical protein
MIIIIISTHNILLSSGSPAGAAAAVQVSTRDHLIPPAMQFELADKLHAKTVTFPTGAQLFLLLRFDTLCSAVLYTPPAASVTPLLCRNLMLAFHSIIDAPFVPAGHMGLLPWAQRYHSMLLEHFAAGAALRQLQQSQAARDWRFSKAVLAAQVRGFCLYDMAQT